MPGDVTSHAEGNRAFDGAIQFNAPISGGVHLPDLENADRLCLQALFVTNPATDKLRIESSKGPLLEDASRWILDTAEFQAWRDPGNATSLLWIYGGPGTGKTMLLCGILDELRKHEAAAGNNLAFFFCERGNERSSGAEAVMRGLLFMLATDPRRRSVIKLIREKYDDAGPAMFDGPSVWWSLCDILARALREVDLSRKGGQGVTYLVIDALDECEVRLEYLLALMAETASVAEKRVKWLVTSRGRESIGRGLRVSRAGPRIGVDLNDHAIEVSRAVETYIRRCAAQLAETEQEDDEIYRQIRAGLQQRKVNGAFLHVMLAARELSAVERSRRPEKLDKLAVDVKGLYRQAEERIRDLDETEGVGDFCRRALSAVAVARRPLSKQELFALAGLDSLPSGQVKAVIDLCRSFFVVGEGRANWVHESAREYFQQDSLLFATSLKTEHHRLFVACLRVMRTLLWRGTYDLSHTDRRTHAQQLAATEYACDNWIEHLVAGGQHDHETRDDGALFGFLKRGFLCWLEYLALAGNMRGTLSSWANLVGFLEGKPGTTQLANIVADAQRFITHHGQLIMDHPLQVYTSALLFSPTSSLVKQTYWKEEPRWVAICPEMQQQNWSPWLQTIDVGESSSRTGNAKMAFSLDGSQLATVLEDGIQIKVWDVTTGQCLQACRLWGRVVWIAFPCQSSKLIAVAMETADERQRGGQGRALKTIVQFWDTANDRWNTVPFLDCATVISAAVFSPDGIWLAAADKTDIGIWDWARGDRTLHFPHSHEPPHAMAYWPRRANLLASAHRGEVCIWNPETGEALRRVKSMANDLTAFSLCGKDLKLVVANNASLKTWNPRTGKHLQTLHVPSHIDYSSLAALSADGSRFVTAPDGDIRIWDVATRRRLRTFRGYYGRVLCLALSPDGTRLASIGETGLKIWDSLGESAGEDRDSQAPRDHGSDISAIAVSVGGTRMVSTSKDAVRVWDTAEGKCLWHLTLPSSAGSGSDNGGGTDDSIDGGAEHVAISSDGTKLALVPVNGDTVQIWDLGTRECDQVIPDTPLAAPVFSHDVTRVAVLTASTKRIRVKLWNLSRGRGYYERPLDAERSPKPFTASCVVFAPDGSGLAASLEDAITVWTPISPDTKPVQLLPQPRPHETTDDTGASGIRSLCFSSGGGYIAASHEGGHIGIWNLQRTACLGTLRMPGGKAVDIVAFTVSKAADGPVTRAFRLLTSAGVVTYDMTCPASPASGTEGRWESRREGYGIDVDGGWITNGSERVLLLPPDHRPRCVAVVPAGPDSAQAVAAIVMGCHSGRVVSLRFSDRVGM